MSLPPDAIHIGFSKCASTFLQTFFRSHPDLFLVTKTHHFAPFEKCTYANSNDDYYNFFRNARDHQVCLESDEHIIMPVHHPVLESAGTTLDSVSEVASRIKRTQPFAKIILVIRNQVDLISSRYSEYLLAGGTEPFDRFVDELLMCSEDGVNYFQNYYCQILERLYDEFSADHVLLVLQEELKDKESQIITELCDFLGVSIRDARGKDPRSRRTGLSLIGVKAIRRLNRSLVKRPAKSYRKADVAVPYFVYKNLQRLIRLADIYAPRAIKGDKKQLLTSDIVDRIRSEYSDDNQRLSRMLGKDLASLGY